MNAHEYDKNQLLDNMIAWLNKPDFQFGNNCTYDLQKNLACILVSQAPHPASFARMSYTLDAILHDIEIDRHGIEQFLGKENVQYYKMLGENDFEMWLDIENHFGRIAFHSFIGAWTNHRVKQEKADLLQKLESFKDKR